MALVLEKKTEIEIHEMVDRLICLLNKVEALPRITSKSCNNEGFKDKVLQIIDYLLPALFWSLGHQPDQYGVHKYNKYIDRECSEVIGLEHWCNEVENQLNSRG